jgi:hypothetical protein
VSSTAAGSTEKRLAFFEYFRYNERMSDIEWNSVTVSDEDKPKVSVEDLRELAAELDPEDFDEPVQNFLAELMQTTDAEDLKQAATLLLQDEVDFSPELAAMGVEPDVGLITLLIATGADVNALNPYGLSPLHVAAKYNYAHIVDMLLTAGAKVTVRSQDGKFAVDYAEDAELKARLALPSVFDDDIPLPPEIEDAEYVPPHECSCGHDHGHDGSCSCSCGHEH